MIEKVLGDGSALEVFRKVVEAQGGDPRVCDSPGSVLPKPKHRSEITLAQGDDAGQGPRTIGAGPGAADDVEALEALRRDLRPQHPAAERIVQRHTVEGDQGASRPRWGDGAQRDALRRRIGGEAGGAAEQGDGGDGGESLVQPGRTVQHPVVEPDHREGGLAGGRRQAGGGDNDVGKLGRGVLEHGSRRPAGA